VDKAEVVCSSGEREKLVTASFRRRAAGGGAGA